eukprot:SAG31_NODE_42701_length_270_cov_0.883041_1_plen_40_part_01
MGLIEKYVTNRENVTLQAHIHCDWLPQAMFNKADSHFMGK